MRRKVVCQDVRYFTFHVHKHWIHHSFAMNGQARLHSLLSCHPVVYGMGVYVYQSMVEYGMCVLGCVRLWQCVLGCVRVRHRCVGVC